MPYFLYGNNKDKFAYKFKFYSKLVRYFVL